MLNRVTLMGRLVADPETRKTSNDQIVTNFTLAVDRDYGDPETKEADFIDCVAWSFTAEFIDKYFRKGSMAIVLGRLQIRRWKDKDGNSHRSAEVNVEDVYFGEPKRSEPEPEPIPEPKPPARSRYSRR